MSFRFSKRFKIAPGITLNVGKRGISTTIGPRGASVNLGKKGVYLNSSIPGTGMSWRTKVTAPRQAPAAALAPAKPAQIRRTDPPPLTRDDMAYAPRRPAAAAIPPPLPGAQAPRASLFAKFLMASGVLFWIVAALVAFAIYSGK